MSRGNVPSAGIIVASAASNMGNALVPSINANRNHVANSPYSRLKSVPCRTRRGYI